MNYLKTIIKFILPAGKASPIPPIGPILGHFGINLAKFCTDFNAQTKHLIQGSMIKIKVLLFDDLTYNIEIIGTTTTQLLLELKLIT